MSYVGTEKTAAVKTRKAFVKTLLNLALYFFKLNGVFFDSKSERACIWSFKIYLDQKAFYYSGSNQCLDS